MVHTSKSSTLTWGAIRSESGSDGHGVVTLRSAEAHDLNQLAEVIHDFVLGSVGRFGIDEKELETTLPQNDWLMGYVAGACLACLRAAGGSCETSLIGFTARICGELMGGGTRNKVIAYELLNDHALHDDFVSGKKSGQASFQLSVSNH